jgi:drug/metabolite transporter (DMT)-like permease
MSALAIVLGLAVAGIYGASDFGGGIAAKRISATWVLVISHPAGLVVALLAVGFDPSADPSSGALIRGAVAGILAVVGLGLLYTALAAGQMGVVAPVTAVVAAIVPVGWGLLHDEQPGAVALIGVALAIGAVALAASPAHAPVPGAAGAGVSSVALLPLAIASGACFGAIFVLFSEFHVSDGMWPLVIERCVSIPLVLGLLAIARPKPRPDRPLIAISILVGALEVVANGLYILAVREGLLSLVGVLGSLYPISTVVLARVVLGERLGRVQQVGLALALVGIGLIAAG